MKLPHRESNKYWDSSHTKVETSGLEQLFDIEEASQQVWDQLGTRSDWKFEFLEYKKEETITTNGKERIAMILRQLRQLQN
jgi:predicted RNA-binding protein with EMAP domain